MDVIGYEAIASCVEDETLAVLTEEFGLRTAVVINEEKTLTVVAALNYVVRLTRNRDFTHARHAENPSVAGRKVNKQLSFVVLCCSPSLLMEPVPV